MNSTKSREVIGEGCAEAAKLHAQHVRQRAVVAEGAESESMRGIPSWTARGQWASRHILRPQDARAVPQRGQLESRLSQVNARPITLH
jgi:hypothetical protein